MLFRSRAAELLGHVVDAAEGALRIDILERLARLNARTGDFAAAQSAEERVLLLARDPATRQLGIATATRSFAVGARVPHIAPDIGAIATQALVNPYYGIDGLSLLREGRAPAEIIE